MASLYIKDDETAALVTRVAKRSGLTKTALVRELAAERENQLNLQKPQTPVREALDTLWREYPWLTKDTGIEIGKAFYDSLNDEDED